MKKKLIIIVTFLFLLSTTGLPISLHYCEMQGSASLSSCEMCLPEENEPESSCCEVESNFSIQIKSDNSDQCCVTRIIEPSVKDRFQIAISNLNIDTKNLSPFFIDNVFIPSIEKRNLNFQFSDSSPPLTNNHIYLLNSVFLI